MSTKEYVAVTRSVRNRMERLFLSKVSFEKKGGTGEVADNEYSLDSSVDEAVGLPTLLRLHSHVATKAG